MFFHYRIVRKDSVDLRTALPKHLFYTPLTSAQPDTSIAKTQCIGRRHLC